MFFVTQYEYPLFSKSGICLPLIKSVDVSWWWPCYSPYMVYLHGSAARCFCRCYQIQLDRKLLPCGWRSFKVLMYQKGMGVLLRSSLLYCVQSVKMVLFYWEHDGLPDVVNCEVCFLCVTMFLFLFVSVRADSPQMPREGTKESFAMLQSSR